MPTFEQVQSFLEVALAGAVAIGVAGTAIEAFGGALAKVSPKAGAAVVAAGRFLEDLGTNLPRLIGREKPRA